jgi:hypothetical protein
VLSVLYQSLITLYTWLAVFPFISFVIIWFVVYAFLKNKKMTTRLSMDITMFFLIGSVSATWNHLFHVEFGFWMIIFVLLVAFGLIGGYQNQTKKHSDLLKVFRVVWRLGFLALFALYIILLLLIIVKNIVYST